MSEAIGYDIRPFAEGDQHGILAGFNQVFRKVCGEGYVDRKMEFWDWEFARNPEGARIMVGVTRDGLIAGHYGGVPVRVHSSHGPATFVHIVDSFVLEAHRAGLKRPGLFVNIGEVWQQMCRDAGDATMYGYPVIAAQRVGSRFLGYAPIHVVDYLVQGTRSDLSGGRSAVEVEAVEDLPAEIDGLFEEFAAGLGCALVRDARYLRWRYLEIPGGTTDYVLLAARRSGRLCGFVVLRPVHELIPGACTVVDWIVPGCPDDVVDALLKRVHAISTERGRGRVMAVFKDGSREHEALKVRGFAVEPSAVVLERRLNHIPADPRFSTEWLAQNWWYTLGDTDLA